MSEKCRVEIWYFKPSGKFYSEGSMVTETSFSWFQVTEMIKDMFRNDHRPGLIDGAGKEFTAIIFSDEHPGAFPIMVRPENL